MTNVRETKRQRALALQKKLEEEAKKNEQDPALVDEAKKQAQKEEAAKKRAERVTARETSKYKPPSFVTKPPSFVTKPRTVLDRSRSNKWRRDQRALAEKRNSPKKVTLPPPPSNGLEYISKRFAEKMTNGDIHFGTVDGFSPKYDDTPEAYWQVKFDDNVDDESVRYTFKEIHEGFALFESLTQPKDKASAAAKTPPKKRGNSVHVSDASDQGTPTKTPTSSITNNDPKKDSNRDDAAEDDSCTTLGESKKDDDFNTNKNSTKDSNNNRNKSPDDDSHTTLGESNKKGDDDWMDDDDDDKHSKSSDDDDDSFSDLGPAAALKARREKKRKLEELSGKRKRISISDEDDEDNKDKEDDEFVESDDDDEEEESKPRPTKKKRQQWIERPAGVRPVRASQQVDHTARGKLRALKKPTEMLWKMTMPHAKSDDFDPKKEKTTGQIRMEQSFPWVIHGACSYMEQGPNSNGGAVRYLDNPQFHVAVGSKQAAKRIYDILHGKGPVCDIHVHYNFDAYLRSFNDANLKKNKKGKKEDNKKDEE